MHNLWVCVQLDAPRSIVTVGSLQGQAWHVKQHWHSTPGKDACALALLVATDWSPFMGAVALGMKPPVEFALKDCVMLRDATPLSSSIASTREWFIKAACCSPESCRDTCFVTLWTCFEEGSAPVLDAA